MLFSSEPHALDDGGSDDPTAWRYSGGGQFLLPSVKERPTFRWAEAPGWERYRVCKDGQKRWSVVCVIAIYNLGKEGKSELKDWFIVKTFLRGLSGCIWVRRVFCVFLHWGAVHCQVYMLMRMTSLLFCCVGSWRNTVCLNDLNVGNRRI